MLREGGYLFRATQLLSQDLNPGSDSRDYALKSRTLSHFPAFVAVRTPGWELDPFNLPAGNVAASPFCILQRWKRA